MEHAFSFFRIIYTQLLAESADYKIGLQSESRANGFPHRWNEAAFVLIKVLIVILFHNVDHNFILRAWKERKIYEGYSKVQTH